MTTRENLSSFVNGIPFNDLPKTLKDAIVCTRRFGLRYLWIDVLCIIQDDYEDKHREISRMQDIFSGAYITIAAASAKDCHSGFLHDRSITHLKWSPFKIPYRAADGRIGTIILEHHVLDDPLPVSYDWRTEPINARAWVSSSSM
jgi:hypothetical protein